MSIRLNKLLAQRGIGARRKCDLLIQSGVVRVNGEVVTAPGARVMPELDRVTVRGRPLPAAPARRYLALHKPVGVISTLSDPEGRRTLRDLIPPGQRLFPVGRLDADTSGLLIVTNDGALAHHLMHPRYGVAKHYRVLLDRPPDGGQLRLLREGVEFEPGVVSAPARVRARDATARGGVIEITLHEGRYRQVRRMCETVGLRVLGLHRWAYGPVGLGELARGMCRELSAEEVEKLRAASARPTPRRPLARGGARAGARTRGGGPAGWGGHAGGSVRRGSQEGTAGRGGRRASPAPLGSATGRRGGPRAPGARARAWGREAPAREGLPGAGRRGGIRSGAPARGRTADAARGLGPRGGPTRRGGKRPGRGGVVAQGWARRRGGRPPRSRRKGRR